MVIDLQFDLVLTPNYGLPMPGFDFWVHLTCFALPVNPVFVLVREGHELWRAGVACVRTSDVDRTRLGFPCIALLALYLLYSNPCTQQYRSKSSWFSSHDQLPVLTVVHGTGSSSGRRRPTSRDLLRLPPHPSDLLRASLVCKRWRCLASDS
jgi:hypothetical protein